MGLDPRLRESYPDIGLEWSGMLKLTKKADYGLIALRHLALGEAGVTASAKEMADAYGLPLPLLSKILQKLARGGMLQSVAGTNGGYRLTRDPKNISAMEVIRTIDGPIVLTSCFTEHSGEHKSCNTSALCSVREPLRRVHEAMLGLLEKFTIAELAAGAKTDLHVGGQHPIQQIQITGALTGAGPPVKPEIRHEDAYIPG
jgi:Rrf2 family protein